MAAFNIDTFNSLGGGAGGLGSVATSFGVPSCMLNMAATVLALLPTGILSFLLDSLALGIEAADAVIKSIFEWLRNLFGLIEWDGEEGLLMYISKHFKFGIDAAFGKIMAAMGALVAAAEAIADVYASVQAAIRDVQEMINCIKNYRNFLKHKHGISDEVPTEPQAFNDYIDENFQVEKLRCDAALEFIRLANIQTAHIRRIISERLVEPSLEPTFNCEAMPYLSGTFLEFNCNVSANPKAEIFRLIYGPPKSSTGNFLLSVDGIYFNSQTSRGLRPALNDIRTKRENLMAGDIWKFTQNPNVGGRGIGFSTKDLNSYVDTILDPSKINESSNIRDHYTSDGLLQELLGNKNKKINDLTRQLDDLVKDSAPVSIIANFKQSIISEGSLHSLKINKRKKQIELAVNLPSIYGTNFTFDKGKIPVNDFSYLNGINLALDLQKQKSLVFSQVDISGVVSPIEYSPIFVVARSRNKNYSTEHLIISENGEGAIIYDGSSVSSTLGPVLQINSNLTTDSLFAMYNFLDTNLQDTSSIIFNTRNSISPSTANYAQLVAKDAESVFKNGLGIPYLHGITKKSSVYPLESSSVGSYLRLPSSKEFNDLLYNYNGATIDFWVHTPKLTSITEGYNSLNVSSLFRLVLANENTGCRNPESEILDPQTVRTDTGNTFVRGFVMGFTRDRRIVTGALPSNINDDNPASDTVFFIAPTQSMSVSEIAFIPNIRTCNDTTFESKYFSMIQPINNYTNGVSLSSCEDTFCHIAITFNPREDEINFYMDGNKITTSGISQVFGTPVHSMPLLPTAYVGNSFEYYLSSVGPNSIKDLRYGPKLDRVFTPWIVGGGYTDGMFRHGNFMGGRYGGNDSGLKGYLGSLKFYSRSLLPSEILNNYEAQKYFFKNIDTQVLNWENIVNL